MSSSSAASGTRAGKQKRGRNSAFPAIGRRLRGWKNRCAGIYLLSPPLTLTKTERPGGSEHMAERALRGTRLGATSYENDRNTDLAPRQEVPFECPKGHRFSVPFAAEAEVPQKWECRVCGAIATTASGDEPTAAKAKPPRSHWDMLMERRTISDLEEVLAERLAIIRGQRGEDDPASQARQRRSA
jgi:hypothetical protein